MHALPIKYPRDDAFGLVKLRGLFVLTLVIFAAATLYVELRSPSPVQKEVSQAQMLEWIKEGHVARLAIVPDPATGQRYITGLYNGPGAPVSFKASVDLALDPYVLSEIRQAGYNGTIETENNTSIAVPLLLNLVPVILFLIVMILIIRAIYRLATRTLRAG